MKQEMQQKKNFFCRQSKKKALTEAIVDLVLFGYGWKFVIVDRGLETWKGRTFQKAIRRLLSQEKRIDVKEAEINCHGQ
jgi:hypothetical protein